LPIFKNEGDEQNFPYTGEGIAAVLYAAQMDYSQGAGHWGKDATIEMILHTINVIGHVEIYPDAFSLQPGSSKLTEAMDIARGG